LTDLKFPSISHYPKSKKLFFYVENDRVALHSLENFLFFYDQQPFNPESELTQPAIGAWMVDPYQTGV
jgi:hypothetical protein